MHVDQPPRRSPQVSDLLVRLHGAVAQRQRARRRLHHADTQHGLQRHPLLRRLLGLSRKRKQSSICVSVWDDFAGYCVEGRTSLYMKNPVKAIRSCSVTAGDCWPYGPGPGTSSACAHSTGDVVSVKLQSATRQLRQMRHYASAHVANASLRALALGTGRTGNQTLEHRAKAASILTAELRPPAGRP